MDDPAIIGAKVKQTWPNGVANDGRTYSQIPDAEIGSMYLLKNGDKGLQALGFSTTDSSKAAAALRKDFTAQSKELGYQNALDSWNRASEVPNDGSGDLTLLYSYIKALDPNSVVREGEIEISKATGSVPENILTAYTRAKEGKLLSPEQRGEYIREVGRIYNFKAKQQQQLNAFYTGLATDSQVDPKKVIGAVGEIKLAELPELPDIQKKGVSEETNGAFTGFLEKTGLHDIPILGGLVGRGIAEPIAKGAEVVAEGLVSPVIDLATKGKITNERRFMSPQAYKTITEGSPSDVLAEGLKTGASAGLATIGAKTLPSIVQGVKTMLPKIPGGTKQILTKGPIGAVKGIIGKKRDEVLAKLPAGKIQGDKVVKAVQKWANDAPASIQEQAQKHALDVQKKFGGKILDFKKALADRTAAGDIGYTHTREARGALATGERAVRDAITSQLPKEITKFDPAFEMTYKAPKKISKAIWEGIKLTGLGKMIGL